MITKEKIQKLRQLLKDAQDYVPLSAYSYGEKCYGYALCTSTLDEKYDKDDNVQLTSGWLQWRDPDKYPDLYDKTWLREDYIGLEEHFGSYIHWRPSVQYITIDGHTTPEQLEAIAWWIKEYGQSTSE